MIEISFIEGLMTFSSLKEMLLLMISGVKALKSNEN